MASPPASSVAEIEQIDRVVGAPRAPGGILDELAAAGRAAAGRLRTEGGRARRALRTAVVRLTGQAQPWWYAPAAPLPARLGGALLRGASPRAADVGATVRWRRAMAVGIGAFAVWALLDAPTLLHSAEAGPLGVRRSVAVAVLRPLAAVSRDLGLAHVVGAADRLLGRHGPGVVQVVGPARESRRRGGVPGAAPGAAPGGVPGGVSGVVSGARLSLRSATDTPAPLPAPTPASPLRVLVVGDSLGVDFGGPFADDLAATGVVTAAVDAQVDTGLARPDYYDWPAELAADLSRYHPQVVVVFLGANDPQNMVVDGQAVAYGTGAWDQAYGARVGEFISEATAAGARVLWVGMPPMADAWRSEAMARLDTIYQEQAASHPGASFFSSWTVLGDARGGFAEYLPDASGAPQQVREPDGTHISPAGAERLSQAVIADMDRAWGLTLMP